MSIRPNSSAQSRKRHLSQRQDPDVDMAKRQNIATDKSRSVLNDCDVLQSQGSSFTLAEILQSTNADTIESSPSSLDPSPPAPQDPYDDPYDDPELDQYLQSLRGSIPIETLGTSPYLKNDTDTFSLEQADQDALVELLKEESQEAPQQPPSSVLRSWNRESRSAEDYDPQLQHSSPQSDTDVTESNEHAPMIEDIDWSNVQEHIRHAPKRGSAADFSAANRSKVPETEPRSVTQETWVYSRSRSSAPTKSQRPAMFIGQVLLKPFKTFFDLQELLDAKAQMFRNQPDISFELFARVVYSSRENFYKKQYFRFRSLLKDCPPYINGALLG
ncbi:hypothetical protein NW762_006100 [Fusarium torreyae]|uniref:Uncharacterized protein n=1 Tax=Fusarium torreyae TaxID=1237075 RepID=A0A9W8S3S7_9HYPO|nr:hypothetical protein NW762_006100 [Fusarium torreyae]